MNVRLMLTCLGDAFYGQVGIAAVKVLEHAGCTVEFLEAQTCCGQPPFNAGDWSAARPIAQRTADLFEGDVPVVVPSSSCAAMVRHGYGLLNVKPRFKTYELCEFIVSVCGRRDWGGAVSPRKVGLHTACHGRMIGLGDAQQALLKSIEGIQVCGFGSPEQCCGFGGSFSVTHANTSTGIGLEKLRQLESAGVEQVVSGDAGCLMHLQGLARQQAIDLKFGHIAQVLAEAV